MTNIAILGSTGSIGRNSLEVISALPDRFQVTVLTAHRNIALLREQIARFHPRLVVVSDRPSAEQLRDALNGSVTVLEGDYGLVEAVQRPDVDLVINSLVGFVGLVPTLRAVEAGKRIALANKETLVVAGELIMDAAKQGSAQLVPVDSEHSAILQCLQGEEIRNVRRLILTASGGPFRDLPVEEFRHITKEQALAHPTWRMGNKITIDSATLMNKGLEVIEAYWLFGLPKERIEVVIHPQSVIHSMVEFVDGSVKAQLGAPDMRIPIQYALTYPERVPTMSSNLDFTHYRNLTFSLPDTAKFRCLSLAYDALVTGGTAPTVLNAANEIAVQMFLHGRIAFSDIPALIHSALCDHVPIAHPMLDDLLEVDRITRVAVERRVTIVHLHS
jgi:1-deoxy-D-xylulose-5-phosphate reductoisomerase